MTSRVGLWGSCWLCQRRLRAKRSLPMALLIRITGARRRFPRDSLVQSECLHTRLWFKSYPKQLTERRRSLLRTEERFLPLDQIKPTVALCLNSILPERMMLP